MKLDLRRRNHAAEEFQEVTRADSYFDYPACSPALKTANPRRCEDKGISLPGYSDSIDARLDKSKSCRFARVMSVEDERFEGSKTVIGCLDPEREADHQQDPTDFQVIKHPQP
jgi:hypothetical protein